MPLTKQEQIRELIYGTNFDNSVGANPVNYPLVKLTQTGVTMADGSITPLSRWINDQFVVTTTLLDGTNIDILPLFKSILGIQTIGTGATPVLDGAAVGNEFIVSAVIPPAYNLPFVWGAFTSITGGFLLNSAVGASGGGGGGGGSSGAIASGAISVAGGNNTPFPVLNIPAATVGGDGSYFVTASISFTDDFGGTEDRYVGSVSAYFTKAAGVITPGQYNFSLANPSGTDPYATYSPDFFFADDGTGGLDLTFQNGSANPAFAAAVVTAGALVPMTIVPKP